VRQTDIPVSLERHSMIELALLLYVLFVILEEDGIYEQSTEYYDRIQYDTK
jgi:hypothetical protein